jgi:hypothetical protein
MMGRVRTRAGSQCSSDALIVRLEKNRPVDELIVIVRSQRGELAIRYPAVNELLGEQLRAEVDRRPDSRPATQLPDKGTAAR